MLTSSGVADSRWNGDHFMATVGQGLAPAVRITKNKKKSNQTNGNPQSRADKSLIFFTTEGRRKKRITANYDVRKLHNAYASVL